MTNDPKTSAKGPGEPNGEFFSIRDGAIEQLALCSVVLEADGETYLFLPKTRLLEILVREVGQAFHNHLTSSYWWPQL